MNYVNRGLIEAGELALLIENQPDLKIVDGSYGVNARANFQEKRIGNAMFFDIDDIADPDAPLPHTIPDETLFADRVSALGISNNDLVIVYDQSGIFMAASRVWWMFRLFGHNNVCVLNGGLPYWEAAGHEVKASAPELPEPKAFNARFRPDLVYRIGDMKKAIENEAVTILDARARDRFLGTATEANPDIRCGHIPNSKNMPFMDLIGDDGRMKKSTELEALLSIAGPANEPGNKIVTTCGSGVTACVVSLALFNSGIPDVAVYDGSWIEWGNKNAGTEVAIGD